MRYDSVLDLGSDGRGVVEAVVILRWVMMREREGEDRRGLSLNAKREGKLREVEITDRRDLPRTYIFHDSIGGN